MGYCRDDLETACDRRRGCHPWQPRVRSAPGPGQARPRHLRHRYRRDGYHRQARATTSSTTSTASGSSTAQIPADKARYGTFDAAARQVRERRARLLDELGEARRRPARWRRRSSISTPPGWTRRRIESARDRAAEGRPRRHRRGVRTKADLMRLMGTHRLLPGPSAPPSQPDPADPTHYMVNIGQSGLGMPMPRLLPRTRATKFDAYRAAYKTYVTRIFELVGDKTPGGIAPTPSSRSRTKIARLHWAAREASATSQATNNPVDRAGLTKMVPAIDWDVLLAAGRPRRRAALRRQRDDRGARRRRAARHRAGRHVEEVPHFPPRQPLRGRTCRRPSTTPASTSTRKAAARRRDAARPLEARHRAARRS